MVDSGTLLSAACCVRMSGTTFHQAVQDAFDLVAVQVSDSAEEVMHKPGLEGLHVFLEGCRTETASSVISAEAVSVAALQRAFEDNEWSVDMSLQRHDLTTLVRVLGGPRSRGSR